MLVCASTFSQSAAQGSPARVGALVVVRADVVVGVEAVLHGAREGLGAQRVLGLDRPVVVVLVAGADAEALQVGAVEPAGEVVLEVEAGLVVHVEPGLQGVGALAPQLAGVLEVYCAIEPVGLAQEAECNVFQADARC